MKRSERNGAEVYTLTEREFAGWESGDSVRDKARLRARQYSRKYGVDVRIESPSGKILYAISPDIA